jgi:magnesium chelatase family protein
MAVTIKSFALDGVDSYVVHVEVNTNFGQPGISIIGMADKAINEAAERIKASLVSGGFEYPESRIVINLAPSSKKKYGTHFDLAMAIGLLVQTDQLSDKAAKHYGFIGELSLNGDIRGVKGVLPMVIEAKRQGIEYLIVPIENMKEAMLVKEIHILCFEDLKKTTTFLEGKVPYELPTIRETKEPTEVLYANDFSDVKGQRQIIRNTVVAAAGGHNMLLIGEPGCGKSMIASRIPTILPPMKEEEALEVTKIQSIVGLNEDYNQLVLARPFRAPHRNASLNALIGGGIAALPGEISLAHNGVLFLDEMIEFDRKTLEALRQPLEDKKVTITRVNYTNTFPANFMLVAAVNPCPCGFYGSNKCTCSPSQVKRYQQRISGPILDRIDIIQKVYPVNYFELANEKHSKSSQELRGFVLNAREIQELRFRGIKGIYTNAQMNSAMIDKYCKIDDDSKEVLKNVFEKYSLSARTYDRLLRIARTYADLEQIENIRKKDIINALIARGIKV